MSQAPVETHEKVTPDFKRQAALAVANERLAAIFDKTSRIKDTGRRTAMADLPDPLGVRELAARIKDHTLDHLDRYLEQLVDNVTKTGGRVHFARTGEQACEIITEIGRDTGARRIVKGKSMVSEEIGLNPELERAGFEVVETDLGEYILQLADERPSHIVTPVTHKSRQDVGKLFHEKLGIDYTPDPPTLTAHARRILRAKFRSSDMGIIGCNFAVAETGTLCIVTNEGNGRFCSSRPRVLVCLMGLEKVIPQMKDLPVFLKILAKSATGQRMTCYTSLITGPKRDRDFDGPEELHLVLLDGGRSRILASDRYRAALRCIRCGACLNACPVYRKIGGHAYESVYPGPIGKVITPLLNSMAEYHHLPQASSLCGSCLEACPVRIDLPTMLLRMRDDLCRQGRIGLGFRMSFKLWRMGMQSTLLYRWGSRLYHRFMDVGAEDGWNRRLPGPASAWTQDRDFPAMAERPFHQRWHDLMAEIDAEEKPR